MRQVFVRPHAGLCNRLRVLVSAVLYARVTGLRLLLHWVPGDGCGCRFDDLFEAHPEFACTTQRRALLPARLHQEIDWLVRRFPSAWHAGALAARHGLEPPLGLVTRADVEAAGFTLDPGFAAGKGTVMVFRNVMQFRPAGTAAGDFAAQLAAVLCSLQPVAAIRRRLFDLPPGTLGVHIRRGDHARSRAVSTDAHFVSALDAHFAGNPGARVFLATDDPVLGRRLRERYGDRIRELAKSHYARHDPRAIQEALADLLMLARCDAILGSAFSSFSELAAAFRQVPLRIAGDAHA